MKTIQRTIFLILSCCLLLALWVPAAGCAPEEKAHTEHVDLDGDGKCDNGGEAMPDNKITYTVTVTCENEEILKGITVRLTKPTGLPAGDGKTLTNGSASFELEAGTYTVVLIGDLTGYTYEDTHLTASAPSATIELKEIEIVDDNKDLITYTVKVEYPDGMPAANVFLQICTEESLGGSCHPGSTDAEGVATIKAPANVYEVHIDACPEGYAFDNSAYRVTADSPSVTVRLLAA